MDDKVEAKSQGKALVIETLNCDDGDAETREASDIPTLNQNYVNT